VHNDTVGQSNVAKVKWTAPPRPNGIKLFINGKTLSHASLTDLQVSRLPRRPDGGPGDV
jgi:hypothetical protein